MTVHRDLLLKAGPSKPVRVLNKLTLCAYPSKPIDSLYVSQLTGVMSRLFILHLIYFFYT